VVHWLAAGVPLIAISGRLGGQAARLLRHAVYAQLAGNPRLVVLDLRPVVAMPLDGVAALVDIACEAGASDIGLCLVCGSGADHPSTLALCGADVAELFEVHPDPVGALATLA
jgi:anti-anti-sigma regulatory factor